MNLGLTFDDVALVPQFNDLISRKEPDLSTQLSRNLRMEIPILAANMESVMSKELAVILEKNGSIPIFPRYTKPLSMNVVDDYFRSIGLHEGLVAKEYDYLCIDVAHGHSRLMLDLISRLKNEYQCEIIAGNVCTPRAIHDLFNAGADAIKVGIGPGAACTTRTVTGFGVPQFTTIQLCAEEAKILGVPIIADGGIRHSGDVVKALAAGASSVMIGKLFACTTESGAEKKLMGLESEYNISDSRAAITAKLLLEKPYAKYRGQASREFQEDILGGLKEGTVPEGESGWAPVTGSAQDLIDQLVGGIKAGMTYGGARTIAELQRKAEFVQVTPSYMQEMGTRI